MAYLGYHTYRENPRIVILLFLLYCYHLFPHIYLYIYIYTCIFTINILYKVIFNTNILMIIYSNYPNLHKNLLLTPSISFILNDDKFQLPKSPPKSSPHSLTFSPSAMIYFNSPILHQNLLITLSLSSSAMIYFNCPNLLVKL